jgi:hypothetical protein
MHYIRPLGVPESYTPDIRAGRRPNPRPLAGARGFDWDYSEYVIIRPLPTRSIAVGGGLRDVLHSSAQVGQYKTYLEDAHTAFDPDSGIRLRR